jgi:hypothetical protein
LIVAAEAPLSWRVRFVTPPLHSRQGTVTVAVAVAWQVAPLTRNPVAVATFVVVTPIAFVMLNDWEAFAASDRPLAIVPNLSSTIETPVTGSPLFVRT